MASFPANNISGFVYFKEGMPYFRVFKARNPVSGALIFDDYPIDTDVRLCVEIRDTDDSLVFTNTSAREKALTFSENIEVKEDNVS